MLPPAGLLPVLLVLLTVTALPVGVLGARLDPGPGRLAPAVAGGLLLAVVGGDLLPDALRDGASSDLRGGIAIVVAAAVGGALTGALVLRRGAGSTGSTGSAVGCCATGTGSLAATALAVHGVAEGLVVGLGVALGQGTALAVTAVVALHRLAEGFALGTALRRSRTGRPRVVALVALATASPLVGGALAGVLTLDEGAAAVLTAAVAGLLLVVAATLLRSSLRRAAAPYEPSGQVAAGALTPGGPAGRVLP